VKPLAIDGYCGLGGWAEGFLAEGYDVVGFDIERHDYGMGGYPGQLVLQDMLTVHGSQFKDAAVIVCSPPCQKFSYMSMPWTRSKKMAEEYCASEEKRKELTALFDACFRIQREASEAAGHRIPMVVENVKGAQPWVGRAKYHYGSFYLWGDVPALMPKAKAVKVSGLNWSGSDKPGYVARAFNDTAVAGLKTNIRDGHAHTRHLTNQRESDSIKQPVWFNDDKRGIKNGKDWFGTGENCSLMRSMSSKSKSRKAASAAIAKIPFALAQYIARVYKP